MEIVFHTGKDSEQSLRQFTEKRAEFLARELRDLDTEEIKDVYKRQRLER